MTAARWLRTSGDTSLGDEEGANREREKRETQKKTLRVDF